MGDFEQVDVAVRWPADQPDPQWVTNFVVQRLGPTDGVVLTFGCAQPLIYGTVEDQRTQAQALAKDGLDVRTVARLVLSVTGARQLNRVLSAQLED